MQKQHKTKRGGFTLVELLVVVLIIGVLATVAIPSYTKSLEKARATEAMNILQALNEAVYTFSAEKGKCPERFSQILVEVPGTLTSSSGTFSVKTKYFEYQLNKATNATIPGTGCGGVVADRQGKGYKLWNPYKMMNGQRSFACNETGGRGICKSLGLETSEQPY